MKYIMIILILFVSGCAMNRHVVMEIDGDNIQTPFGIVDGKFKIDKITQFGRCAK